LEHIFKPLHVDWRLSQNKELRSKPARRAIFYDFFTPMSAEQVSAMCYSSTKNVWIETNVVANANNFIYNTLTNLGFPSTTLLDLVRSNSVMPACAFHSLFERHLVKPEVLPPGPQIGIHLRFGDRAMGVGRDNRTIAEGLANETQVAQLAVTCAQQLAQLVGFLAPCVVIVESDSMRAKQAAKNNNGGLCKVWTSAARPSHTAHTVNSVGGSNWLAWARLTTVELLLFTGSTFSRSAGSVGAPALDKRRLVDFKKFAKLWASGIQCKI